MEPEAFAKEFSDEVESLYKNGHNFRLLKRRNLNYLKENWPKANFVSFRCITPEKFYTVAIKEYTDCGVIAYDKFEVIRDINRHFTKKGGGSNYGFILREMRAYLASYEADPDTCRFNPAGLPDMNSMVLWFCDCYIRLMMII